MPLNIPLSIVLLTMLGFAVGQNDCGNCLHLDSGAVVGIVTCDVIITVLIAGMAFWMSSKVQKKKYEERLQQKNASENVDHTYEHLHGQHLDVYTDLNTLNNSS
ncbi:TYRO protein tyrosine kinase-binding protein [Mantella aurantiaca]